MRAGNGQAVNNNDELFFHFLMRNMRVKSNKQCFYKMSQKSLKKIPVTCV